MPFVYVTLATLVTLATAGIPRVYLDTWQCGLARHNRMHVNQSERLLVKPKRPCTDLCAEPVGMRNRLAPPVDSSWTEHVEPSEESRISETWLNYFASFTSKMINCTGYTTPILFKQYHTWREFVWQIREQWLFTNLRTPCCSHKLC